MLLGAAEVDAVAVMYCPTGLGEPADAADGVLAELDQHQAHKPVLAAWLGPLAGSVAREPFAKLGIPNFDTPEALVRGSTQLTNRHRQQIHLSNCLGIWRLAGQ